MDEDCIHGGDLPDSFLVLIALFKKLILDEVSFSAYTRESHNISYNIIEFIGFYMKARIVQKTFASS